MFSRRFLIIGARANYGSIASTKCFNGLDEVFQRKALLDSLLFLSKTRLFRSTVRVSLLGTSTDIITQVTNVKDRKNHNVELVWRMINILLFIL